MKKRFKVNMEMSFFVTARDEEGVDKIIYDADIIVKTHDGQEPEIEIEGYEAEEADAI
jgi:hypothetical protein